MKDTYPLSIVTPLGRIFHEPVEGLTAPGLLGRFGILPRHTPVITSISPGYLTVRKDDTTRYFAVDYGVIEVNTDHSVLVLTDHAELCESQEMATARADAFRSDRNSPQI